MRIHLLQMCSEPNVTANLNFVRQCLQQHAETLKGGIVLLPECFALFGGKDKENLAIAEVIGSGSTQQQLSELANEFNVYIIAGSFPTQSNIQDKFFASCLVYSPQGELICDYQKIHLFDVQVADGTGSYLESKTTEPGNKVVCFDTPHGRIGLAICYDLRFPGLFQSLAKQGVDVIVLPSAFTQKTGEAHWHTLLKARAIENQIFVAGCNQSGTHANGRETYGHSLVISPWGDVMFDAQKQLGLFTVELPLTDIQPIRNKMPIQIHNRFNTELQN